MDSPWGRSPAGDGWQRCSASRPGAARCRQRARAASAVACRGPADAEEAVHPLQHGRTRRPARAARGGGPVLRQPGASVAGGRAAGATCPGAGAWTCPTTRANLRVNGGDDSAAEGLRDVRPAAASACPSSIGRWCAWRVLHSSELLPTATVCYVWDAHFPPGTRAGQRLHAAHPPHRAARRATPRCGLAQRAPRRARRLPASCSATRPAACPASSAWASVPTPTTRRAAAWPTWPTWCCGALKRLLLLGGGHAHVQVLDALAKAPVSGLQATLVTPYARQMYSGMVPGLLAGHYGRPTARSRWRRWPPRPACA